jgi:hypothetical protein
MTAFERWRTRCPYGRWTCADGRTVLFNRDYAPIFARDANGTVSEFDRTDAVQWIKWTDQTWFFDDGDSPVSYWNVPPSKWQPALARVNAALAAFNLAPMPKRPPKGNRK